MRALVLAVSEGSTGEWCQCPRPWMPGCVARAPPAAADPQGVARLARAVKEHERREGTKIGFSSSPADCLAFQFFRDVRALCPLPETQPRKFKR